MDRAFAGRDIRIIQVQGGYQKLTNSGMIPGYLPMRLGVFGSWRATLEQDRLATMSPIYMDLIKKAQAEAQPGARREKFVSGVFICTAAFLVVMVVYDWTSNEKGWTSVALFTWPLTFVIGGVFLISLFGVVWSIRIGRRWIVSALIALGTFGLYLVS